MKFCSECGSELEPQQVSGKKQPIYLCPNCQCCFANHPKIVAACFVNCGDKLLWMKRGNEPRRGYWAIPAGYMEEGETVKEAAARELFEETGLKLDPSQLKLYSMGTISFISEVYIAFRATIDKEFCECGEESLDVQFFSRDELPWDQIAFPQANNYIEVAYDNLQSGHYEVYHCEMTPEKNNLIPVTPELFPF